MQQAQNLPGTGTSAAFTAAETAGDFNVVIVGWGDQTSSINSVTDSNNNTYILVGTTGGQNNSQAIYYANSISVSTTTTPTVSANFVTAPAGGCDMRVLEYTGFSSSSVTVDNWIGNSGGNSPATSNTFTTSTTSLLVGAGTTSQAFLATGLPGYMTSRGINGFGDVAMDSNGTVAQGTYQASANLNPAGGWVMQGVGFSISGISTSTPTVTNIAPTSGGTAGGDPVTITGTNFAPGANAFFNGLSLVNCQVTSSTSMTCNTPADNEGPKDLTVVNVDGKTGLMSMAFTYTINPPVISSISPAATTTNGNTTITITGSSFQGGATVNIGGPLPPSGNGEFGDNVKVLSSSMITFTTPALSVGVADLEVRNPDSGTAIDPGALSYTLGTGPINYIQRTDAATSSTSQSPSSQMTNPQTKGNTNIVVIGWSDTTSLVSSVTDTEGNVYQQALPVFNGSNTSQTIYYAKNIKGDNPTCAPTCNTITVNFNKGAASPDVRYLEYSGLDPNNPLDTGASNGGNGTLADTGICSTTAASELIVAAATVDSAVTGAGTGYTTVDYTFNGDNVEHQITTAIGSCEATAPLDAGNWVIQSVAFKAGVAGPPTYSITADPPTSATVTAGDSASYALTLAGTSGFSTSVNLTCSGLPAGASCSFSPNPVTPGSSTPDTLTLSTTGATPGGTSTVTISGTPTPSQTAQVTLTVTAVPNFTLSANPTSATIGTPGGSATSMISATATGGFSGTVALTCAVTGGGSLAPTCLLSSSSISGSATSTLTVNTTPNSASNPTGILALLLLPIGGVTLLGAGFSSRRKQVMGILLICMLIAGFVFITSCGGGSSKTTPPGGGTPPGTYTVTVTGTSGSLAAETATFTVIVQ